MKEARYGNEKEEREEEKGKKRIEGSRVRWGKEERKKAGEERGVRISSCDEEIE